MNLSVGVSLILGHGVGGAIQSVFD